MTEKEKPSKVATKTRRRMIVGGGLLGTAAINQKRWVKPIVAAVVMPSHASLTDSQEPQ